MTPGPPNTFPPNLAPPPQTDARGAGPPADRPGRRRGAGRTLPNPGRGGRGPGPGDGGNAVPDRTNSGGRLPSLTTIVPPHPTNIPCSNRNILYFSDHWTQGGDGLPGRHKNSFLYLHVSHQKQRGKQTNPRTRAPVLTPTHQHARTRRLFSSENPPWGGWVGPGPEHSGGGGSWVLGQRPRCGFRHKGPIFLGKCP